jgi:hypothetical protein
VIRHREQIRQIANRCPRGQARAELAIKNKKTSEQPA